MRKSTTELYEEWREGYVKCEWYEALSKAWKRVLKRQKC